MILYATIPEFYAVQGIAKPDLTDEQEARLNGRLRAASARVRAFTREYGARYTLTADGFPAEGTVREAFRIATAAFANADLTLHPDPAADEDDDSGFDSVTMAGVTLSRSKSRSSIAAADATSSASIAERFEVEALAILRGSGIFGAQAVGR